MLCNERRRHTSILSRSEIILTQTNFLLFDIYFLCCIQFSMWPLLSGLVKRAGFDWPRPILAPQLTWKISPFNCKSLQRIKSFVSRTCEQNNSIRVKFIKFAWSVFSQDSGKPLIREKLTVQHFPKVGQENILMNEFESQIVFKLCTGSGTGEDSAQ